MRGLVWLTIASAFAKKPADGAHEAAGLLPLHAGGRPRHTRVHQRVRLRARRGEAGVVGRPEDRQRRPAAGHGDDADFE